MSAIIESEEWKPTINPWLTTVAVMTATFIFVLDSTIANVALPHMAGTFSSSNEESMWILTTYIIASGIILPSVNWFSHIFGRKNFFIGCIAIFTTASFLCGLANSMDQMILARILQGLGGGALLPISQAILMESFPKEKRGLAMSIFGMGVVIAPIIGPVLGGFLTDAFSWRWIFFINIPFGIFSIICSKLWIEDPPYAAKQGFKSIDYVGFAFLIVWLATLQTVLDKGNNVNWFEADWICWLSAISIFSFIGFVYSQITNKNGIIDLSIFKDKNFTFGTIVLVVVNAILYASTAILPLFLQSLLGYSAFLSGYATMPRGVGAIAGVVIAGTFSNTIDERILGALGLLFMGIASIMFGFLSLQISMINIIIPNMLLGLGMSLSFITLSMNTLNNTQMTNASGIQSLVKNIGGAVGTSIVATMLSRFSQMHQHSMVKHLNELNPAFQIKVHGATMALAQYMHISVAETKANYLMYAELLKQSTLWAFIDAFRIFGLLALVVIPIIFMIDKAKHDPDSDHMAVMH